MTSPAKECIDEAFYELDEALRDILPLNHRLLATLEMLQLIQQYLLADDESSSIAEGPT